MQMISEAFGHVFCWMREQFLGLLEQCGIAACEAFGQGVCAIKLAQQHLITGSKGVTRDKTIAYFLRRRAIVESEIVRVEAAKIEFDNPLGVIESRDEPAHRMPDPNENPSGYRGRRAHVVAVYLDASSEQVSVDCRPSAFAYVQKAQV